MDEVKKWKCESGKPCDFLDTRLEGRGKKGLVQIPLMNIKTGAIKSWLVYKMTPKDNGLLINYCPFCGFKYEWEP